MKMISILGFLILPFSFISCKKNNTEKKDSTGANQDGKITSSSGVLYNIFDSCTLSNSWTPNTSGGPNEQGAYIPYSRKDSIIITPDNRCVIRRDTFNNESLVDSTYFKYASKNFVVDFNGFPETKIFLKDDSIFIVSTATAKYNMKGYLLRGLRK